MLAPANGQPAYKSIKQRAVMFREGRVETPVHQRDALPQGTTLKGPAIVTEEGATTVLPPGFSLVVDSDRNLVINVPTHRGDEPQRHETHTPDEVKG